MKTETVKYLTADLIAEADVKHGWFMRHGGVSPAPYKSLNTKISQLVIDDVANSAQNQQRAYKALDIANQPVVMLHLVGQDRVETIKHKGGSRTMLSTDGAATNMTGHSLALTVADCLPVLLVDKQAGVIGVAHAGWFGAAHQVTSKVIALMQELGARPDKIVAAIGPSICGQCYEVKDDVASLFDQAHVEKQSDGTLRLDLWSAVESELANSGVKQVDNLGICTYEQTDHWFSARKEGQTGRFLAVINCP